VVDEYNVYKGATPGTIDETTPVATVTSPTLTANVPMTTSETAYFLVKASRTGAGESLPSNMIVVEIDSGDNLVGAQPNAPQSLSAICLSAGRIALDWYYNAAGQEAPPSVFNVYHNAGSGAVDYGTIVGTATYIQGKGVYRFETGALSDGVRYTLAVRAQTAAGAEEKNTVTVSEVAIVTGPPTFPASRITVALVDVD
jgi:hypothetical protein